MQTDLSKKALALNTYVFCGTLASLFLFFGVLWAIEVFGLTIRPWMFLLTYFVVLGFCIYSAGLVFLRCNAHGLTKEEIIFCLCGGYDFRLNRRFNEAVYGWVIDKQLAKKNEKEADPDR